MKLLKKLFRLNDIPSNSCSSILSSSTKQIIPCLNGVNSIKSHNNEKRYHSSSIRSGDSISSASLIDSNNGYNQNSSNMQNIGTISNSSNHVVYDESLNPVIMYNSGNGRFQNLFYWGQLAQLEIQIKAFFRIYLRLIVSEMKATLRAI